MQMADAVAAFVEAADTFAGLLGRPEVATRWDEPGTMEGYTVGAIAGHVIAAMTPLDAGLAKAPPPADVKVIRLGRYYAGMKVESPADSAKPMHGMVHRLSHDVAADGWEATAARFRSYFDELGQRLSDEPDDRLLDLRPMIPVGIVLIDMIRTRVMELVVHADDLATSVGLDPPTPSPAAATVTIETLLATARANHGDLAVLRALARKERVTAEVFPVF